MNIAVSLFYLYIVIGLIFGLWFILKGVNKVDDGMDDVHWGVRALIFPGSVALWPILLQKWFKARKNPHSTH